MKCPNCGEPIKTRHTFCVICNADLKDYLANGKKEDAIEKKKNVQEHLQKLVGKMKQNVISAEGQKNREQAVAAAKDEPDVHAVKI
ncbi:MAG: hypothetical protein MJ071_01475 [Oscillospiraceae bacterium]|nr:hypothetical protein [Oscillospiraceae bacterium]